jgi:hypothetical protein
MHTITVKARDTASALKEVARQLGDDAMIISTKKTDGIVVVEAAAEVFLTPQKIEPSDVASLISAPSEPAERDDAKAPMFTRHERGLRQEPDLRSEKKVHSNFAEYLEEQERLQGISHEREEIVEVEKPLANDPLAGWSSLSPEFCDELRSDLASIDRSGHALGFLGQVKRQVLTRDASMIENARRVIIVGAPGSGKSLVAAKMAAHMMTNDAACRPELVLANARGRSAGALLTEKAQLMNIRMRQCALSEIDGATPDLNTPEIIEVNGATSDALGQVQKLAAQKGTQVVVVLPAGLHPRAASRICSVWRDLSPVVVMTRLDDWLPTAEDIAVLLANGMRLAWTTQGESVLDAFDHPGLDALGAWARTWLSDMEA